MIYNATNKPSFIIDAIVELMSESANKRGAGFSDLFPNISQTSLEINCTIDGVEVDLPRLLGMIERYKDEDLERRAKELVTSKLDNLIGSLREIEQAIECTENLFELNED